MRSHGRADVLEEREVAVDASRHRVDVAVRVQIHERRAASAGHSDVVEGTDADQDELWSLRRPGVVKVRDGSFRGPDRGIRIVVIVEIHKRRARSVTDVEAGELREALLSICLWSRGVSAEDQTGGDNGAQSSKSLQIQQHPDLQVSVHPRCGEKVQLSTQRDVSREDNPGRRSAAIRRRPAARPLGSGPRVKPGGTQAVLERPATSLAVRWKRIDFCSLWATV